MTDTELVEAMCEAAAEHPEWANQSQMEAALSVVRPIIERELLKRMMSAAVHGDYLPCIGQFIAEFDARERGIEIE